MVLATHCFTSFKNGRWAGGDMISYLDQVFVSLSHHDLQRARMVAALVDFARGRTLHLDGNEDDRRRILDLTPNVKLFEVKSEKGLRLGNHYHQNMDEWYFAVSGEFDWTVGNPNNGERRRIIQSEGQVLYIPRNVAHVVVPSP